MIKFQFTRRQRLHIALNEFLDWVFKPVTIRLTHDEYFSCSSRSDCVRVLAKRLIHG